jgi:hypothetical protein
LTEGSSSNAGVRRPWAGLRVAVLEGYECDGALDTVAQAG